MACKQSKEALRKEILSIKASFFLFSRNCKLLLTFSNRLKEIGLLI